MANSGETKGLVFSLEGYFPLAAFEHGDLLWSTEFQRLILESSPAQLGRILPQAKYVPATEGQPATVTFLLYNEHGDEVAGSSVPALHGIPRNQLEELQQRTEEFAQLAENPRASSDRRRLIKEFKLANPRSHPEFYRLYGSSGNQRLLVLWGMERKRAVGFVPPEPDLVAPQEAVGILKALGSHGQRLYALLTGTAGDWRVRAGALAILVLLTGAFVLCRLNILPICGTHDEVVAGNVPPPNVSPGGQPTLSGQQSPGGQQLSPSGQPSTTPSGQPRPPDRQSSASPGGQPTPSGGQLSPGGQQLSPSGQPSTTPSGQPLPPDRQSSASPGGQPTPSGGQPLPGGQQLSPSGRPSTAPSGQPLPPDRQSASPGGQPTPSGQPSPGGQQLSPSGQPSTTPSGQPLPPDRRSSASPGGQPTPSGGQPSPGGQQLSPSGRPSTTPSGQPLPPDRQSSASPGGQPTPSGGQPSPGGQQLTPSGQPSTTPSGQPLPPDRQSSASPGGQSTPSGGQPSTSIGQPSPTPGVQPQPERFTVRIERSQFVGGDLVDVQLRLLPHGSGNPNGTQWSIEGINGMQAGAQAEFKLNARREPYIVHIRLPSGKEYTRSLTASRKDEFDVKLNDSGDLQ